MKKYSHSYQCSRCGKFWKTGFQLNRHEKTCEGSVVHKFPGGVYRPAPSLFEQLKEQGIEVPERLKYYPYWATYDIEVMLVSQQDLNNTDKLEWTQKHVPASVSICSNVPEFTEPVCLISHGNPHELVAEMVEHLESISAAAEANLMEDPEMEALFESIEQKLEEQEEEEEEEAEEEEENDEETPPKKKPVPPLFKLKAKLEGHLAQLPVVGFNSGKYDINALKAFLMPILMDDLKFTIKKTNTFMCLSSERLRFLDILSFLAPGFSYAKFLKAYGCTQTKGFFPYEWFDSLDKLEQTCLPPSQAFHSTLRNEDISEEDYAYCQRVWQEHNMQTMRDFLEWYNNLDVEPFCEAIQKMSDFWKEKNIDMLKQGISIPGVTLIYLFATLPQDTFFTLFREKDKDLYYTLRDNMVGGPSIIFHRYHEKGKTKIRQVEMEAVGRDPNLCQGVVGYDANALYLWSIMQEMPTGHYARRRAETGFRKEYKHTSEEALEWMEWLNVSRGLQLQHEANGSEKRVGRRGLPVDGFDQASATAFQYHGCYWHGCKCQGDTTNAVNGKTMAELRERTEAISTYLRKVLGEGHLVEMWGCQWAAMKRNHPEIREFLRSRFGRPLDRKLTLTEAEILEAVQNDTLFGIVECDIHVPDPLKAHFSEMPPVFKNTEISREDIGPFMKAFAEDNNIMPKPRRSLIGSFFATKIMLATPLLKWYLAHGLEVPKIYQVVEYTPKRCFEPFGNAVSNARRAGDRDPDQAIIADTMKLVGNSSYGKTITNQERHRNVEYCSEMKASQLVNESYFRGLVSIDANTYEVEKCKKTIKLNLPSTIGFFVYQNAKWRMLEFYYDCVDKYLDRSDFQLCEMDTDSAYMALSGESVESLVKPELREAFEADKANWFPRTDTPEHRAYDKRKPGLFKEEWQGDGIIGLCSKTYYCFGAKDKFSCKGVSKGLNAIDKDKYLNVLLTQRPSSGVNRGFRTVNNTMYTYNQVRDGFSYFYPKRKVLDDGVSTQPLDI